MFDRFAIQARAFLDNSHCSNSFTTHAKNVTLTVKSGKRMYGEILGLVQGTKWTCELSLGTHKLSYFIPVRFMILPLAKELLLKNEQRA